MGFLGSSVTLLCRRGCTKLGLTWDQLFGGQGQSRRGLGSSGGSKESRWLLAARHVNPLVAAVPTELGLEAVSPGAGGRTAAALEAAARHLPNVWDCFHLSWWFEL